MTTMTEKAWSIDLAGENSNGSAGGSPTRIKVELHDPAFVPALQHFADSEELHLVPDTTAQGNTYWFSYPREDTQEVQERLDSHLTEVYWMLRINGD
jgi:hypothetical protein